MITRYTLVALPLLVVAACNQSGPPVLPTAPSEAFAASAAPTLLPAFAGGSTVAGRTADRPVEVRGQISRLTGRCPNVAFVVNDVTVNSNESTEFRGGSCDEMAVRTWVLVKGVRQGDGTLLALHVVVHDDRDAKDERRHRIELEGVVTDLRGACPDISFSLRHRDVTVLANRSTEYRVGGCEAVKDGVRVHVKGTRHDEGKVLAAAIKVREGEPERPQVDPRAIKLPTGMTR